MDVIQIASSLRGFAECLSYSDTISSGQLEKLKEKLEELISVLENDNGNFEDSTDDFVISPSFKSNNNSDDLPF